MVLTLLSPLLEDHQSLKLVGEQASLLGMVHSDIINNYMRSFNSLNDTQSVKILYKGLHSISELTLNTSQALAILLLETHKARSKS